jgi:hypothetical protein
MTQHSPETCSLFARWCEHERRRRLDVEDQAAGSGAVREMEEPGLRVGRPSAVAVQAEAANHPELLR